MGHRTPKDSDSTMTPPSLSLPTTPYDISHLSTELNPSKLFDQALALVALHGTNTLMAKLDVKHAFHLCPVSLADHELLGIEWKGQFYDLCLPFGLCSSPYFFNRLADAAKWILQSNYHIHHLMHYLDNDFTVSPSNCANTIQTIIYLASSLDIPLVPDKLEGPTTCLAFLRILIDNTYMETPLPAEKLEELLAELQSWSFATLLTYALQQRFPIIISQRMWKLVSSHLEWPCDNTRHFLVHQTWNS